MTTPSDKIVELFQKYRENEIQIDQLRTQSKQKAASVEKLSQTLRQHRDDILGMNVEHHQQKKLLVNANEHIKALDALLLKEKEYQLTLFSELQYNQDMLRKLENVRLEDDLYLARSLRQLSAAQVSDKSTGVKVILHELANTDEQI